MGRRRRTPLATRRGRDANVPIIASPVSAGGYPPTPPAAPVAEPPSRSGAAANLSPPSGHLILSIGPWSSVISPCPPGRRRGGQCTIRFGSAPGGRPILAEVAGG